MATAHLTPESPRTDQHGLVNQRERETPRDSAAFVNRVHGTAASVISSLAKDTVKKRNIQ